MAARAASCSSRRGWAWARRRRSSARTSSAWPTRASRGSGSGSASPTTRCRGRSSRRPTGRVPGVRGAVPGAVHRDHRGGVHEDPRRAVRRLAAGGRRGARAHARRDGGCGGRGDRRVARARDEGLGDAPGPARHPAGCDIARRHHSGRTCVGGVALLTARRDELQPVARGRGPSHLGAAGRREGSDRGVPRGRQAGAAEPARPDRRRTRALAVRDRAGEVPRRRRHRAPPPGGLLRRARGRLALGRGCRPRPRPVRVRARRARRGRGAGGRRRRTARTSGRGSRLPGGGGFLVRVAATGWRSCSPATRSWNSRSW